ncbi:hypothetical protein OP10G_4065 [Fimbriimonas ginsengisoli Gsoil 348]|uniref:Uncharacterized protein n=1 Tax=Fimbriimonas ginsengisoli Gsoil 348 TaxID=661478 RepID=A0A068NV76_FIMGI|nr:hypothetical protein OP10G_4065 [Fimbriimonas ginsengisoli Gsoil 348]
MERWADGDKYAIRLAVQGITVMDTRFDGRRVFRNMVGERYATVATPRDGKAAMGRDLGVMWTSATSIDDFLKVDKAEVLEKKETSLPDGKLATRYDILFGAPYKEWPAKRSHLYVYVDSGTARIVRWEQLIRGGEVAARGVVEYPSEVSAGIFEGRASAGTRLYDIDWERQRLASMMKTGIGTLSVKGAKATVRAVLLDRRNSLTVLWTGASPNGDLAQPLRIPGIRFESRPFGLREFTTGRGLEPYSHLPSTVVADHLGGMSQTLKEAPREGIDIEIPVFTEDHKTPIRNKAGKTVGYRSRFVGYDTLRNVKPLQIPDLWSFADELGIRRAPPAK